MLGHRRALALIALAATIAGCARPSDRIASELTRYGLDQARADCIGQRLERDLSIAQLRELAGVVRAYKANDATPGVLTLGDLTRVAGSVRDPQVPITVATAAAGCGVTVTDLLR